MITARKIYQNIEFNTINFQTKLLLSNYFFLANKNQDSKQLKYSTEIDFTLSENYKMCVCALFYKVNMLIFNITDFTIPLGRKIWISLSVTYF